MPLFAQPTMVTALSNPKLSVAFSQPGFAKVLGQPEVTTAIQSAM